MKSDKSDDNKVLKSDLLSVGALAPRYKAAPCTPYSPHTTGPWGATPYFFFVDGVATFLLGADFFIRPPFFPNH